MIEVEPAGEDVVMRIHDGNRPARKYCMSNRATAALSMMLADPEGEKSARIPPSSQLLLLGNDLEGGPSIHVEQQKRGVRLSLSEGDKDVPSINLKDRAAVDMLIESLNELVPLAKPRLRKGAAATRSGSRRRL